tara:strand:+ start:1412 stop:1606 length:195 start_codon:yes stop_codon:yes gene_type:complete
MVMLYKKKDSLKKTRVDFMGLGLKLFWGTLLSALIAGALYLAAVGVPSPAVEVRKKIEIEKLLH